MIMFDIMFLGFTPDRCVWIFTILSFDVHVIKAVAVVMLASQ